MRFVLGNKVEFASGKHMGKTGKIEKIENNKVYVEIDGKLFECKENDILLSFPWDEFLTGSIGVHCKTEIEAINFLHQAADHSISWHNGTNLTSHTNWNVYKDSTVYEMDGRKWLTFGFSEMYFLDSKKIVKWSDYMELNMGQNENARGLYKAKLFDWKRFKVQNIWTKGNYQKRYDDLGNEEHYIFSSSGSNSWSYMRIDPNTLCQYTGVELNGIELWENDIVSNNSHRKDYEQSIHGAITMLNGAWQVVGEYNIPIHTLIEECDGNTMCNLEILGNIYDTPSSKMSK